MGENVQHQSKDEVFPGWGQPVNAMPNLQYRWKSPRMRFQNAITDWYGSKISVREILMMSVMRELMEKVNWEAWVFDDSIAAKWRVEALQVPGCSEKMWEYVSIILLAAFDASSN